MKIQTILASIALSTTVAVAPAAVAFAQTPAPTAPHAASSLAQLASYAPTLPTVPCSTEDATDCVWDATSQGNHAGRSFWSIKVADDRVCIRYFDRLYGAANDYCTADPYAAS